MCRCQIFNFDEHVKSIEHMHRQQVQFGTQFSQIDALIDELGRKSSRNHDRNRRTIADVNRKLDENTNQQLDQQEPSAQYYLKKFAELDNFLKITQERAQVRYLVGNLATVK